MRMRLVTHGLAWALLGLATSLGCAPVRPVEPTRLAIAPPRLVVALVVDQLPLWLLLERAGALPESGGFARLLGEADHALELRYRHAHNATAPGHATLFTGASPHDSGVTSNGRVVRGGRFESSLTDPGARLVAAAPLPDRPGPSLQSLHVPTVADALRAARPGAFVASLSLKDRGAIFGGGRAPTATLWFDAGADGFVTSSALATSVPDWAKPFATPGAAAAYRRTPWTPRDRAWLDARLAGAPLDADVGQGDFHGLGRFFPHDLAAAASPAKAFVATPFADAMLVDLATAAIDAAAATTTTEPGLLALSFSTHDYVAHVFGPDAPEAWDELLRLDEEIARLLAHLDRVIGPARYAVVLASDHGGPQTPEGLARRACPTAPDRFERPCGGGARLVDRELAAKAEEAVDRALGAGDWIEGVLEPFVALRPEVRDAPELRDRAVSAVIDALSTTPGIALALDVRRAPTICPDDPDRLDALVCRSIAGETGGDVFFAVARGSFVDTGYVEGDGCNHGSPWLYDRAVPFVVRTGRADAARLRPKFSPDDRVDDRAYAVTLAGLLGVAAPPHARGGSDRSR